MKTILIMAGVVQACVLYLLIGFAVNALYAKVNGYKSWKEWYKEEDTVYLLCLTLWPIVIVMLIFLLPCALIGEVLDRLSGRK